MKKMYIILSLLTVIQFGFALNVKNVLPINENIISKSVLATPTASISGSTSVCQGAASPQITFTGAGGTAPYTFTYNVTGVPTNQTITTSSGDSVTIPAPTNAAGSFVYTLVSVKDSSNPLQTQNQTGTATVTVNAPPTVDFTFTNENTCSGTVVQFTSNTLGAGYSYEWDFGDGTSSSSQNPSHVFEALGCSISTLSVKLTITDSNGCSSSIRKNIIVKQKPDIGFEDVNATSSDNQFSNCERDALSNQAYTIKVGNISKSSSCITSYSINWGDNSVENSVVFPISHTYNSLGVYNMVISATASYSSYECITSKTYVVKNISNPAAGILSPGSTANMCIPTDIIQYTIGNWGQNSPGTTYSVDYGDGLPILYLSQDEMVKTVYYKVSNPSLSTNYPVPYSYTTNSCPKEKFTIKLVVTNACKSTEAQVDGGNTISKTVADFTAPKNYCSTSPVTFINNSTLGYVNSSCKKEAKFLWNFGDPVSGTSNTINSGFVDNNPNVSHTFSGPGVYIVTLTAQNSCGKTTKTQQICIEPSLTKPTITLTPANASNCAPLKINASTPNVVSNCITPIQYLWTVTHTDLDCDVLATDPTYLNSTTSASQNPVFNFATPGTYSIQLKMTNSCGVVESLVQTLIVKKPPVVSVNSITDLCAGNSGTTTISPTANVKNCGFATSELIYNWSFPDGTPATSSQVSPQVTYTTGGSKTVSLFISTTNGCANSVISNQNFVIGTAPNLNTLSPVTQVICSGSTTTALPLTAQSGTTFSWSATTVPAGVNVNPLSGTTNLIPALTMTNSNSQPKTVILTINSTLNGCSSTNTYNVTVNPAPSITQPTGSLICLGGIITPLSVSISPTPTSGTATYKWYFNKNGDTNIATSTLVNTSTIDGNYTPLSTLETVYYFCEVTFSSVGSCQNLKSNAASVIVNRVVSISTQPLATQSLCVGGTIPTPLSVIPTGGTGTASYQWYSNTTNLNTGGTLIPSATNAIFTPTVFATIGSYYYYATVSFSGNGCGSIASNTAEIMVVSNPIVTVQPLVSQTLCQGATPTNLTVVATGRIGTYSYQWFSSVSNSNSGGILISGANNVVFTPPTDGVGTLYYYCVITQPGVGCDVTSATAKVTVNISPAFTTTLSSSPICLGQTPSPLTIVTNSDSLSPNYQWYSNATNLNSGGTQLSGANNATFNPPATPSGTMYYYCQVTFSSMVGSCSIITSSPAEVIINPNPVISNKTTLICSGNSFAISPDNLSGDLVPVGTTYTWSNPTISPAGSITGASAQNIQQSNISQNLINTTTNPAIVTYTVSPLSGVCKGIPFAVIVTINPAISPNVTPTNCTCFGVHTGAIQTNITGGIPPYIISWTSSNGFTSSAPNITNLYPGDYTLSITDQGGCPINETFTIKEPAEIIITTDLEKDITCFNAANGEIKITLSGGTLNYKINWTKNGIPYATSEYLSNLSPGTYVVTVSDANNCSLKTATFTITEPPVLAVSLLNKTNILCFGQATGVIDVDVTGGTFPYTYSWTNSNGFSSFNEDLTNVLAGTYTVLVTDNLGCAKTISITLTQPTEIKITATTTPIICYGGNDASISLTIAGGISPYNIAWSNLGTGTFQNNLSAGDYTITVTDNNNCLQTLKVNIPEAPIFTVNPVVKNISCFGLNNGSINLNFVGGIAPIKLTWSDGSTAGTTRNNLKPGTYTVTIIDSKPCTIVRTFTILEPQALVLSANLTNALDCNNANTGAINLLVSGGSAPFTYAWSNGATTEDLVNIPAGNYLVTVTDVNGCSKQAQYSINRPPPIVTSVVTKTDFDCDTKSVKQTFVAQVSGGVPPYKLNWSSGIVSGINNELMNTTQNGTVILYVTDALNCPDSYSFTVAIPKLGVPSFETNSYAYLTYGTYSISDPIQFTNTSSETYVSIAWDFGDGSVSNEENPLHTFVKEGNYLVTQTVTYAYGCVYKKTLTLKLNKGYQLMVPNGFTPNLDGINETFKPVFMGITSIEIAIYDTWGELVYSEKGATLKGWDGTIKSKESENGNYYYKIKATTFYGTILTENGPFTLIK
ncbi:PKD domain-containing protein [Flavobacterium restrictum]|uniref:PKD domain-containing protein n=1 Tax=Flavobacterium restrictum TaxID=2594428 RepID=A0A553DZU3_9FLAO|nr:PKD domain-containing protein [Flavobacterium restrictum]TRX38309.1 PKD domain-containing protein [Flavobacterium restrictum]